MARAFSVKLATVIDGKCQMKASQLDADMYMRREPGRLAAIPTKHPDDLKLAGTPGAVKHILAELQKYFGTLKVEWYAFTRCGVRHVQDRISKEITLDQAAYTNSLQTIVRQQLAGASSEDECCPTLRRRY
eukprot:1507799-Lingulodinium_polyedra.AAC.1